MHEKFEIMKNARMKSGIMRNTWMKSGIMRNARMKSGIMRNTRVGCKKRRVHSVRAGLCRKTDREIQNIRVNLLERWTDYKCKSLFADGLREMRERMPWLKCGAIWEAP